MSRHVDVKALVSHIVKGDGLDKCRICMGDTSQGQVHLEDTVMMNGEQPVTLSELLEVITGVEVEEDATLPACLCQRCSEAAISAASFKEFCQQSAQCWNDATVYLTTTPNPRDFDRTFFIFCKKDGDIFNIPDAVATLENAVKVLNEQKNKRKKKKRKRQCCVCPHCSKRFSALVTLNEHLKYMQERFCYECSTAVNKKDLANHLLVRHNKEVVDCTSCHELFNNTTEARSHWLKHHGGNSQPCNICGMGFSNARGLRAHYCFHTLFHCSCGESFENSRCYKHHLTKCKPKKHSSVESIFECDHCGVQYDKKPSLRIHIVQKHLNVLPFVCQTCGKRTSTRAHLRSHEKIHEKERKVLQCYCGAKFRSTLGFKLHMRIHSGDKPYKCEFCEDSFLSASRRLDHVKRRHQSSTEMPHGCKSCGAKFIRPWELKKHYLNVHSSVVDVKPCRRFDTTTRRMRSLKPS